jgi:hypothetical protein
MLAAGEFGRYLSTIHLSPKEDFIMKTLVMKLTLIVFSASIFIVFVGTSAIAGKTINQEVIEKSLKSYLSNTNFPFVELVGIHLENDNTATAYFKCNLKKDKSRGNAKLKYLLNKGWYIIEIYISETSNYNPRRLLNVLYKIQ